MATGIAVRCRRDARCRQFTGKRLSRTLWSSFNKGCGICVTVRLPVRPRGETTYWQANANTPLSVTPLLNVPYLRGVAFMTVLAVLAVLQSTLPCFCFSYKRQYQEAAVTVLTVLAVSAVVAVSVVTATPLIGRERTTPNLKARKSIPVFWANFSPVRRGLFPVVRDFLCIIPTEQVLYYRTLGLYYGLASGTLPLYSGPCLGVKGGCVSCDLKLNPPFPCILTIVYCLMLFRYRRRLCCSRLNSGRKTNQKGGAIGRSMGVAQRTLPY